ncbi:Ff.00g030560.m01.CDS01 [Fusarium sp. VM40]|nr:Ff.00g030560.m01.CDS01 [Fusarium sp. VM40]
MASQPIVLSPATPSELLSYIISNHRYPTTLIIGSSKSEFQASLIEDIAHHLTINDRRSQEDGPGDSITTPASHGLLKAPLYQIAISRHIRILFAPTVTHLRAYLSVFTPNNSPISAPPNHKPSSCAPLLLIYGLLALHRDASEWSAQGIGNSAALFVDAASRNASRAAIIEPKGAGGHEDLDYIGGELVPLLNGTTRKDDGSWSGRTVSIKQVLNRWFEFQTQD